MTRRRRRLARTRAQALAFKRQHHRPTEAGATTFLEELGEYLGEQIAGPAIAKALERPDIQRDIRDAAASAVETDAVQRTVLKGALVVGGSIIAAVVAAKLIPLGRRS